MVLYYSGATTTYHDVDVDDGLPGFSGAAVGACKLDEEPSQD